MGGVDSTSRGLCPVVVSLHVSKVEPAGSATIVLICSLYLLLFVRKICEGGTKKYVCVHCLSLHPHPTITVDFQNLS
jgi:hypothetical protein